MKLLKARIQNYRIHRDLEIDLDAPLTLLQGPNESGKSTLVEAIHRTLFLNAKGTSESHKEMESTLHDGTPTVELSFSSGGRVFQVRKEFGGTKGKTELSTEGEAPLTGEAAESRLAEILGVDGSLSGGAAKKGLPQRWAHLWVRQGTSEVSPINGEEVHSPLRRELQQRTGMGILVSQNDSALIAQLQYLVDESFTASGKVKAGSKLSDLEKALEQAHASLTQKQQLLDELKSAAERFTRGKEDSDRHRATRDQAEKALQEVDSKLDKAANIEKQHQEARITYDRIQKDLDALKKRDQQIRETTRQLEEIRKNIKPEQEKMDACKTELQELRDQLAEMEQSREALTRESRLASQTLEAWKLQQNLLRTRSDLEEQEKALKQIKSLEQDVRGRERELAKLDAFDKACLNRLQKLSSQAETARARLDAFALKVELLESDQSVAVNGTPLANDQALTLTQASEVTVGEHTRLRLTPGSHQDLEQARQSAEDANAALTGAFDQLGINQLEQATDQHLKFQQLKNDLEQKQQQLEALDPTAVAEKRDALSLELERQQSSFERLNESLQIEFSDDPDSIRSAIESATAAHQKADSELIAAQVQEAAQRKKRDQLGDEINQLSEALSTKKNEASGLESGLKLLTEQNGDPAKRAKQLSELELAAEQAEQKKANLKSQLEELGHSQLKSDQDRLRSTIENSAKLLRDAENNWLIAEQTLRNEGSSDPHREVLEAEAKYAETEEALALVRQQAETRRDLLERLKNSQAAKAQSLAKPLEEAADPYLQAIFGTSAKARLRWSDEGTHLDELEIDRTGQKAGLFEFEKLSHGTREQVSLAIRLAMAEVLANAHDGTLPVVLDDAFTHADKDRIEKLKRVLFQGTQNGLQIILLSCHPENYSGLTPNEISLG